MTIKNEKFNHKDPAAHKAVGKDCTGCTTGKLKDSAIHTDDTPHSNYKVED